MKYLREFLVIFSWITAFNPAVIPIVLSCAASVMAIINYYYSIKKNRQK